MTEHTAPETGPPPVVEELDERAARATLRGQIGYLERELVRISLDACPRLRPGVAARMASGPRLLSLGELECVRDELAGRLAGLHRTSAAQAERQEQARALLARMYADPPAYKWVRVSNEDLGEPGCRRFHVRPRLGPVGLLMSWWRVKLSSGCPLAWGS